jgi:mono/diheme cytochrome c family protein
MRRFRWSVLAAALACAGSVAGGVAAQEPDASPIWGGVYTTAEADAGKAAYELRCAGCHRNDLRGGQTGANFAPALGGDDFMLRWDSTGVDRLFRIIRDTMPRGTPGTLGPATARDLVAYLLQFNGFPSGAASLPPDEAALTRIVIRPKLGAARTEVANFAPVQVVGCVTQGSAGWLLTQGTDAAPAAAATALEAPGPGTKTYRLLSAAPHQLDGHVGSTVRAKGLIRRDPDETLITLTAIDVLDASCPR